MWRNCSILRCVMCWRDFYHADEAGGAELYFRKKRTGKVQASRRRCGMFFSNPIQNALWHGSGRLIIRQEGKPFILPIRWNIRRTGYGKAVSCFTGEPRQLLEAGGRAGACQCEGLMEKWEEASVRPFMRGAWWLPFISVRQDKHIRHRACFVFVCLNPAPPGSLLGMFFCSASKTCFKCSAAPGRLPTRQNSSPAAGPVRQTSRAAVFKRRSIKTSPFSDGAKNTPRRSPGGGQTETDTEAKRPQTDAHILGCGTEGCMLMGAEGVLL